MNMSDVAVTVEIVSLRGERLSQKADESASTPVKFNVNARLEEKERKSGKVVVLFALAVGTKPSVVKYELEGITTLMGKDDLIEKMLEIDPETKVPFLFHKIYQHIFMTIYLLATLMDTIYPPSNLLFVSKQIEHGQDLQKAALTASDQKSTS